MQINLKEEFISNFKVIIDVYNGITIKSDFSQKNKAIFENDINELINYCENKFNLIWIYVDIAKTDLLEVLTTKDFKFHTCNESRILLVKKILQTAIVPTAANNTLGVGVVVINNKNELLVIKEKISDMGYKLPGGHVDDGEMISRACVREVFEETGISVEFESVISLGHFYPHQFDKSNLYILCKAKPVTNEINIIDCDEIEDAKWIDLNEYLSNQNVLPYIKEIVNAALNSDGLEIKNEILDIKREFELLFPKI